MMGNISRILAVATAFLSIAFLGFAGVTTFGGPNWNSVAQSLAPTPQDPGGYVFTKSVAENPQWTATFAGGDGVKTATVLPDVIVAAFDHKIAALKTELDALSDEQPKLEQRNAAIEAAIAIDEQALSQAVTEREQFLESQRQLYSTISQQVVQKTEEAQQVEQVVESRRTDVFRLANQLEVLKADNAGTDQVEQQMLDLIRQIDADLAKAQRRQDQLKSQAEGAEKNAGLEPQPAPEN